MSETLVTVALPTYNAAQTVAECLRSLEAQTFPREQMQILVGDNGSTDGTLELIATQFPRVEVAHATGRGSGYARNAAFALARGKYICSIDADCVAAPGWVAAMVAAFAQGADTLAGLGGDIQPYCLKSAVERYRHAWLRQEGLRDDVSVRYAATLNAAFRRSALDKVGLFDGTQGFDDTDLGLRLTAAGFTLEYVPEAVVRHRNPATLRELYRHRVKYGMFSVRLARKHPAVFGSPDNPDAQRREGWLTARRVIGDLTFKLPLALMTGDRGQGTRWWPVFDAALALGLYVGARRAWGEKL